MRFVSRVPGGWRLCMLGLALVLAGAGCDGAQPLEPQFDQDSGEFVVQVEGPGSLVQTVRLSNARPSRGDTLRVVSTVVNRGGEPAQVTARICGLDLRTELALHDPWGRCRAYSTEMRLAPGDSAWALDGGIIGSHSGEYTLRVRHLLDPQQWLDLRIHVQ